jgi:hypothetical protein
MSAVAASGRRLSDGRAVTRCLVAAWLGAVLNFQPVCAQQDVSMSVSATVLKRATLTVLSKPSLLTVSNEDIARGYVDATASTTLALKTNSGAGLLLEFVNHAEFVQAIRVQGLGPELQMSAAGGFFRRTARPVASELLDLRFRFELSGAAREGVYAWPVHVAVQPL